MALLIPYPVIYSPQTEDSFTRILTLPPRVACPQYPILNFTNTLGEQWNCQRCIHHPYFGLYEYGDKIPLQLNLPDDVNGILFSPNSVSQPSVGWKQVGGGAAWYIRAELYDGSSTSPTLIYSFVDQFCSDWWVGYSELVGSIQTLIIDTSLFPLGTDTFRLKIVTVDQLGADKITLWSEPFCIGNGCNTNVKIEATYATIDCYNRDYRNPADLVFVHTPFNATNPIGYSPTPFYASWRFLGEVAAQVFAAEKTLNDNNKVIRTEATSTYRLIIAQSLPVYAAQILAALLQADEFSVDGISYDTASDISKNVEKGKGFLPSIDLTKSCKINNNKCN